MKPLSYHKTTNLFKLISLFILALVAVLLMGVTQKQLGWTLYGLGLVWLGITTKGNFRKHIAIVYMSLGLLGLIPITTEVSNENFIRMGLVLSAALLLPFIITRYILKDHAVDFRWHHGRRWLRAETFYVVGTALGAYFFLPYYLTNSGAYLNWSVENTADSITRLFIGTNVLGLWDELFFVNTILGLLRRYLPFWQANLLQAVLFTSFLFELGFTGWGPLVIYPFALSQGYIFRKTNSLLYVITIHLTLDFVLFLALLNAHHPELADIFIF
jgi:membrane protease YdiL (CAAX protease family)